jgi:hypothetical protein
LISQIREVVARMPNLAPGKPGEAYLVDYGKSSIELEASINVATTAPNKQIRQDFLIEIAKVLARTGVRFEKQSGGSGGELGGGEEDEEDEEDEEED